MPRVLHPTARPGVTRGSTAWAAVLALLLPIAVLAPTQAEAAPGSFALNNGLLRFGAIETVPSPELNTGAEDGVLSDVASVSDIGTLRTPMYRADTDATWYQLTYQARSLDLAVGIGSGAAAWHGNPSVASSDSGAGLPISGLTVTAPDFDGVTADGVTVGTGTLEAAGTVDVGGTDVEVAHQYELDPGASHITVTTTVTNPTASQIDNVNLWVGTRDDWIGTSDDTDKTRGNLVDGGFVPIDAVGQTAAALKVTTAGEGVLFYSTTPDADTAMAGYGVFKDKIVDLDPSTAPTSLTVHDGAYGITLPVGDLAASEGRELTWFYAAGPTDRLDQVIADVAEAAAPPKPDASIGNGSVMLDWVEPASDDPIVDYEIRWSDDGGVTWQPDPYLRTGSTATSATISDLANGTEYRFQVRGVTGDTGSESFGPWSPDTDVATPGLPVNDAAPAITGDAIVGATLTVDDPDENWTNHGTQPLTATYQWQADGVDIDAATGADYTVTDADAGRVITVVATRTNEVGSTEAVSADPVTIPVAAGLSALTVSTGTLTPAFGAATRSYQLDVSSSTSSLTLTPIAVAGATITVDGDTSVSGEAIAVDVPVGSTTVELDLTGAGSSGRYTVTIVRPAPARPAPTTPDPAPTPVPTERGDLPAPGTSTGAVDGTAMPITVTPVPDGGVSVGADGFAMRVAANRDDANDPSGPPVGDGDTTLGFVRGEQARIGVQGFAPNSAVKVWLFSEPQLLGEFTTDGDGELEALTETIDGALDACQHTLHAEGRLPDGREVELSVGVWVEPDPYPFGDVGTTSVHRRAIGCLADLGVTNGVSAEEFAPEASVTRGQTAALLARALGLSGTTSPLPTDVTGSTHEVAIGSVLAAGIAEGFPDGSFRPERPLSRGQLAGMLATALGLRTDTDAPFPDAGTTHGEAIAALAERDLITGFADGTVRPDAPMSRAQLASVLARSLPLIDAASTGTDA